MDSPAVAFEVFPQRACVVVHPVLRVTARARQLDRGPTRRDLTALARISVWALVALIAFSVELIFVSIPNGALIYSVLVLVIFVGLIVIDFQRLRRSSDVESAPLLAASIFLDILNVFLFFLRIFSRADDR